MRPRGPPQSPLSIPFRRNRIDTEDPRGVACSYTGGLMFVEVPMKKALLGVALLALLAGNAWAGG